MLPSEHEAAWIGTHEPSRVVPHSIGDVRR
jgi:hypothetical protein